MEEPIPDAPSPLETRVRVLEVLVSILADQVPVSSARALALQHLLAERGVLDFDAVRARMAEMQESADTEVELSQSPEHTAWRALRRSLEAGPLSPEDRKEE